MDSFRNDSLTSGIRFVDGTLSYVGHELKRIPEVFGKLYGRNVTTLDLSYNEISNIKELENFPILTDLVLDNNEISDSARFPIIDSLRTLSINKNCITDLEMFIKNVAVSFPNLTFLSLLGNKACPNQLSDINKDDDDYERYRIYVLYHLRNLKFLDSTEVSDMERKLAASRGEFMSIKKPKMKEEREELLNDTFRYTPLPGSSRSALDHQSAYGKCRFRYAGIESEGNRFIGNNDL